MARYLDDIEKVTKENENFRKVVYTGKFLQLVVMNLKPGEDIGKEIHPNVDQFFRIEEGEAKVIIDGKQEKANEDFAIVVPAGSEHNLVNNSKDTNLKLYTIYSPSNHPENTIHRTQEEARKAENHDH